MVTLKQARFILAGVALLQAVWFGWALHRVDGVTWGDTHDYQYVAGELAHGHLGVVSEFFRPPGYPALLLVSQALGIKPTVAAVVFNRAAAVVALAVLPPTLSVGIAAGYLLLCSYSTVVSYENFLMSESPMAGFLLVAWVLGLLAFRLVCQRRYELAALLLATQMFWLTALKPAFKAYSMLAIAIIAAGLFCASALPRLAGRERKRLGYSLLALLTFSMVVNGVVFRNSGTVPMILNKAITLVHVLPFLSDAEVAAMPPHVQKSYGVYRKLWVKTPENVNGIPVEAKDGAELFDYLYLPHFFTFFGLYVRKMAQLVYFSGWNQNFGEIDMHTGIPRGFGSLGIILTTCLLGAVLAWGLGNGVKPETIALLETGGSAAYGFLVQMFIAANDDARISMMWVIPCFVFLAQAWWLAWWRLKNRRLFVL